MAEPKPIRIPFRGIKGRKPTILVVEDEVLLRVALAEYLRDCGFKVYEASNGADAISLLKSRKYMIDLVLSDVDMPDVDGFTLAQWIHKYRPDLPIQLASGDRKKSDNAKTLCENEPFFAKPYDLQKVVAFVRNAIEARAKKKRSA
ncbi:MAG: response regulator [Alphaproteobacteria bacterium]|nr:response regulator [Alphaproteobacteria bacterium]